MWNCIAYLSVFIVAEAISWCRVCPNVINNVNTQPNGNAENDTPSPGNIEDEYDHYSSHLVSGDTTNGPLESYLNTKLRISVTGQIENYTKWPLHYDGYTRQTGQLQLHPRTVQNGTVERWTSQKKWGLFGNQIQLKFNFQNLQNRTEFHVMYDVPYNYNFHSNILSTVLCTVDESQVSSMNHKCPQEIFMDRGPHVLADHAFIGLERQSYRETIRKDAKYVSNRNNEIVVHAIMSPNHHSIIMIRIFPTLFFNLDYAIRTSVNKTDYETFLTLL